MKKIVFQIITLLCVSCLSFAQQTCGEDYYKRQLAVNPELKLLHDNLKYQYLIAMDKGELGGGRPEGIEIKIPVVFNILHTKNDNAPV